MLQTSSERQKTTSDSNQRTALPLSRPGQHSVDVGPARSSLTSAGDDDSLVLKNRESSTEGLGKPMISDCITCLVASYPDSLRSQALLLQNMNAQGEPGIFSHVSMM